MRIKEIEISGFRGIREKLRIPFCSGFTVITGRNGSGKSSVCDAIEYLFTQQITRVSAEQAEKGERLEDYIWWRGKQRAAANALTGRLEGSATENGGWSVTKLGIEGKIPVGALFDKEIAPPDPLPTLCRTSILRDELITWLSTDLAEGARAEFVEHAIGIVGTTQIENTIGSYVGSFRDRLRNAEGLYESHREKIFEILEEISEAEIQTGSMDEERLKVWTQTAAKLTGKESAEIPTLLSGLASKITSARRRVDQLERLSIDLKAHAEEISDAEELLLQQNALMDEIMELQARLKVAEENLEVASKKLRSANEAHPTYTSLAALREHGMRVGLRDGTCPLCGARLTKESYDGHLHTILEEVTRHQAGLDALVREESDLGRQVAHLQTIIETSSNRYNRNLASYQVLKKARADIMQRAELAGVILSEDEINTALRIQSVNLEELERCSEALQGFVVSERVKELQKRRVTAELDAD